MGLDESDLFSAAVIVESQPHRTARSITISSVATRRISIRSFSNGLKPMATFGGPLRGFWAARLRQNRLHNFPRDVCQAKVAALVTVGEAFVVDA